MPSQIMPAWKIRTIMSVGLTVALLGVGCQSQPGESNLQNAVNPFSTPSPKEVAATMLDSKQPNRRRRALTRIAQSSFGGKPIYLKAYRALTRDPSPTVRAAAAQALAKRGEVKDAQVLADLLDDPSHFVRWEAAKGLQAVHNPNVVDPLIVATRDDDSDVRMAATQALGQYPRSLVFDTLVGELTDNNYAVKRAARQSLITLTGEHLGPGPEDWLDWAEQNRGSLFAGGETYTYLPWAAPPTWWQRLVFWGFAERPSVQPHQPTGL